MLFRRAKKNSRGWNLFKTSLHTAFFWSLFLIVIPLSIEYLISDSVSFAGNFFLIVGVALFCLFSALGIWSGFTLTWFGEGTPFPMDTTQRLVTGGPYAYVRNPMAIAGLGQGFAIAIILESIWVGLYVFSGVLLWHFLVRPLEEKDLEHYFGSEYIRYSNKVKCWMPKRQSRRIS